MPRRPPFLLVLLAPLLLASRCHEPPKPVPDETEQVQIQPPEVELQVAAIEPSTGPTARVFGATVYGAGFERGARVRFGEVEAADVDFLDDTSLAVTVPPLAAGEYDVGVLLPDGTRAALGRGLRIRGEEAPPACLSATVHFDFDSYRLSPEEAATLSGLVPCLQRVEGSIRIEGHCDERGTTEYNLALGQRRAEAVERLLVGQGIAPGRVRTISYGEERPLDPGHDEQAWRRNRRAELRVSR